MCLTLPVRVVTVEGPWAIVETGAGRRRASTLAQPDARPGDWAILAAGTLVEILDAATAREMSTAVLEATRPIDDERSPR